MKRLAVILSMECCLDIFQVHLQDERPSHFYLRD